MVIIGFAKLFFYGKKFAAIVKTKMTKILAHGNKFKGQQQFVDTNNFA